MADHGPPAPWRAEPIEVDGPQAYLLLKAAVSVHQCVSDVDYHSDSERELARRRAQLMAGDGLMTYRADPRRGINSWLAYSTCLGWNALWRHYGDTHIDHCGDAWQPDGVCVGCGSLRRLDLAAWRSYLDCVVGEEPPRARLWCNEHGYLRARDVVSQKACRAPGTPLHDGGLVRV